MGKGGGEGKEKNKMCVIGQKGQIHLHVLEYFSI